MVPVLICFDYIFTEFYEERGAFIKKCFSFLNWTSITWRCICSRNFQSIDPQEVVLLKKSGHDQNKLTCIYLQGKPLSLRPEKRCFWKGILWVKHVLQPRSIWVKYLQLVTFRSAEGNRIAHFEFVLSDLLHFSRKIQHRCYYHARIS